MKVYITLKSEKIYAKSRWTTKWIPWFFGTISGSQTNSMYTYQQNNYKKKTDIPENQQMQQAFHPSLSF